MDEKTRNDLYNAIADVPVMGEIFVPYNSRLIAIVSGAIQEVITHPVIVWIGEWDKEHIDLAILDDSYEGDVYADKTIILQTGDIAE